MQMSLFVKEYSYATLKEILDTRSLFSTATAYKQLPQKQKTQSVTWGAVTSTLASQQDGSGFKLSVLAFLKFACSSHACVVFLQGTCSKLATLNLPIGVNACLSIDWQPAQEL